MSGLKRTNHDEMFEMTDNDEDNYSCRYEYKSLRPARKICEQLVW